MRHFRVSTSETGVEKLFDIGEMDALLPLLLFDEVACVVVQLIVKFCGDEETSVALGSGLLSRSSGDLALVGDEVTDGICLPDPLVDWGGESKLSCTEPLVVDFNVSAAESGVEISTVISVCVDCLVYALRQSLEMYYYYLKLN